MNTTEEKGIVKTRKISKKPKKSAKQIIGTTFSILIVTGIVGTGGYFINQNINKQTVVSQTGSSGMIYRGLIESIVSGNGKTVAQSRQIVGEKLRGEVTEVFVKTGDNVSVGDLLMTVNPEKVREDLNEALDVLDNAQEELRNANLEYSNLIIKAPFTGKIIEVCDENQGSNISAGMTYATIVDDSIMKLEIYYSYGYVDTIQVGQQAIVSIPATTSNVEGTVSKIDNIKKISPDGTILFKVTIDIKNPGTLTKDMIATAVVKTPQGDVMPAETSVLEYNKTQDIIVKASGELTSKNVHEYYIYNSGDKIGTISDLNNNISNQVKSATRAVESAQETVNENQEILANTELRSTVEGMVSQISVVAGDELSGDGQATPIAISNLDSLKIDIQVSEMDITKVQMGMPVMISYEATDGMNFLEGEITALSLEATQSNDNYSYISYFPATVTIFDPQNLRPDMNVQYNITASFIPDALLVPVSAIVYTDVGASLYIKEEYANGFETFPIIDPSVPNGYVTVAVEVGISDGYNSQILTELPENTEFYMPNSDLNSNGFGGGYGTFEDSYVMIG